MGVSEVLLCQNEPIDLCLEVVVTFAIISHKPLTSKGQTCDLNTL